MAHRARRPGPLTVDEFLVYPAPDGKAELVRGELRVNPPTGARHGIVAANVLAILIAHVRPAGLGAVFADAGFELLALPRTVRAPDVAFVRAERIPREGVGSRFLQLAPDLAVEVLSPSETATRLQEKLDDYHAAAVPLVWVIDSDGRTIMTVDARGQVRWLREGDMLDGGDVIAGFACTVSSLFEGTSRDP